MRRRLLAFALGLAAGACGGGGGAPTSVSTPVPAAFPAGTVLSFASGETNQPVVAAKVTVGTGSYLSDQSGQIVLGESLPVGTTVSVAAEGFMERRTLLRTASQARFTLWPRTSTVSLDPDRRFSRGTNVGLDELWTQELVYTDSHRCGTAMSQYPLGGLHLRHAKEGITIPVGIAQGALKRNSVEGALRIAIDLANQANEARTVFQYAESAPTDGIVVELVAPDEQAVAAMAVRLDGQGHVIGGRLQFMGDPVQSSDWEWMQRRSWFGGETDYFANVMAHELGHALGFWHAYVDLENRTSHWGLMSVYSRDPVTGGCSAAHVFYWAGVRDFSPAEKLALKLMYQRRPYNRYPDDDTGVRGAAAERGPITVCRLAPPSL